MGLLHRETESDSESGCHAVQAGQGSASRSGFKTRRFLTPEATILEDDALTGGRVSNSVCSMSDCVSPCCELPGRLRAPPPGMKGTG